VSTSEDIRKYFRIVYGREYYTWVNGKFEIVYENKEGIQCT